MGPVSHTGIDDLPTEVVAQIFDEVIKSGVRPQNNTYNFSGARGGLRASKKLSNVLVRALEERTPLIAFETDIASIRTWCRAFQIPWVSDNQHRVSAFIATGRCRLQISMRRTVPQHQQTTFRALLLARDLGKLCNTLSLLCYQVTAYLWQWNWSQVQQNGDIWVVNAGTPPPLTMTITRGAVGIGISAAEERRMFAKLEQFTLPGMTLTIHNRQHPTVGVPTTDNIMAPQQFSFRSAAWAILDRVKMNYRYMTMLYTVGNWSRLLVVYRNVDQAFRSSFLMTAQWMYAANPQVLSNIAPQAAAATAILLDCGAMLHLLLLHHNRWNEAWQIEQDMIARETSLQNLYGVLQMNPPILQTVQNINDIHPEVARSIILSRLVRDPHTGEYGLAELDAWMQSAITLYADLCLLLPARQDIQLEHQTLVRFWSNVALRTYWRNGALSPAQIVQRLPPGPPAGIPYTAAAHNLAGPPGRRGWL